jgi:pimeloyl-ACP methyl ester carboxylesterase
MKQQIQFCTTHDGVQIAFAKAGEGPPLVRTANWFTHLELDWDRAIWRHWFEVLAEIHTLIRYDPRGSGLSDRDVHDLRLDAWISDLEAVVDAAGLRRFPLLGLCQGGVVAAAYAARDPDRATQFILYDSYLSGAYAEGVDERVQKAGVYTVR